MTTVFHQIEQSLDPHSGHHLYKQIKRVLRQKIDRGQLKPGDHLLPLRELGKAFKVSEMTARRAVQELVQEGVLVSRPGSGTFVCEPSSESTGIDSRSKPRMAPVHPSLGIVFADITEGYPLFEEFVRGMRSVAGEDRLLQFFEQRLRTGDAVELASRIPLDQIAGLVMISPINLELATRCQREHVPCVLLYDSLTEGLSPCVVVDYALGMTLAMRHLHERGRRKIAFVSSGIHLWSSRQNTSAYRMGQQWLGLEVRDQWLIHAGRDEPAGYDATRKLLAGDERPDAIIFGTDFSAKGGLHALQEANIEVPKDMAVVGMGNILRKFDTPLEMTSIDIKVSQEGEAAADLLLKLIEHPEADVPPQTRIEPQLIVRETT